MSTKWTNPLQKEHVANTLMADSDDVRMTKLETLHLQPTRLWKS
jgi:hypothetical protein